MSGCGSTPGASPSAAEAASGAEAAGEAGAAEGAESSAEASADGTSPSCPVDEKVTVEIQLTKPVACPGHPLQIGAMGKPGGGTYDWTISGDGELVHWSGEPASTGGIIFMRCFKPDDAAGNIPERTATVKVTYTHPKGTANDSKDIKTHKIDFDVTNMAVTGGTTEATETAAGVSLGPPGVATMSTDPSVKIKLDPSCPRKPACAQNHQVGFLQTVTGNDRRLRYTHTLIQVTVALPIRDQINGPAPFYNQTTGYSGTQTGLATFTGDGDTKALHHEDSPAQSGQWTDPRAGVGASPPPAPPPAKNLQLRQVFFTNSFKVWLVVQNIEWAAHHPADSFVYLRHYDWSMHLDVTVDTSKAVGSRCTPRRKPATIGAVGVGKGGSSPTISAPYPNVNNTVTVNPAPGI